MFLATYDPRASFVHLKSRMIISVPGVEVNGCSVDGGGRLQKYNSEDVCDKSFYIGRQPAACRHYHHPPADHLPYMGRT